MLGLIKAGIKIPLRRHLVQTRKIDGSPKDVCDEIISNVWNGKFYQTGSWHFDYFWVRDFGIVANSLVRIGKKDEVHSTIKWVLNQYQKSKRFALCVDKKGHIFNAPKPSIDGLPWMVYAIAATGYPLGQNERAFLEKEIDNYICKYLDKNTGLIKPNVEYSELRDAVNYKTSSYSVSMVLTLSKYAKVAGLHNFPFSEKVYQNALEKYWNGLYYDSDIDNNTFSAECNLFPFYLGLVNDKEKIISILDYIDKQKINQPYPMKYTDNKKGFKYHWWGNFIMPNYAGSTVWTWMGAIYIFELWKNEHHDFKLQFEKFTEVIKKHKNFPELLMPNGDWYKTFLYKAEEGMIWSAIYLDLLQEIKNKKTSKMLVKK